MKTRIAHPSRRIIVMTGAAYAATALIGCSQPSSVLMAPDKTRELNGLLRTGSCVEVSQPTGEAIQTAIDSLASGGGCVLLTAATPYIIDTPLTINSDNIQLIGKGEKTTVLQAKKGAKLTVPYHAGEFVMLIQSASDVAVSGFTVDTINEANDDTNGRVGIGVWNCSSTTVSHIKFVHNLSSIVYNQGLSLNQSTTVTVKNCLATQAASGIFVWECQSFEITNCECTACEALVPPNFTGGALNLIDSSGGKISGCNVHNNKTYGGIFVTSCYDVQILSCRVSKTLPFRTQPGNDGIITVDSTQQPDVIVQKCTVVDNSGAGVSAYNSSYLAIKANTIANSGTLKHGGSGVSLNGGTTNVTVKANKISDDRNPGYPGIIAGFSTVPDTLGLIEENVVKGFGYGVSLGSSSSYFRVLDNDLQGNVVCIHDGGTHDTLKGNMC